MENALTWPRRTSLAHWRELVWPREHGSWSFALEPMALGLIAVPSVAGGWLALAVGAAFFARRPLRIAWGDEQAERRRDARVARNLSDYPAFMRAGFRSSPRANYAVPNLGFRCAQSP